MTEETLYKKIAALSTFQPSKEVNDAFSDLVTFCDFPVERKRPSLKSKKLNHLRMCCSLAEKALEHDTAMKIIKSNTPQADVEAFPYYANYLELTKLEFSNLSLQKQPQTILFVGGGPLPLTAMLLAKLYNVSCVIIDNDGESTQLAKSVIKKLSLEKKITCVTSDAKDYTDYGMFDTVILAALVGTTSKDKNALIDLIAQSMRSKSLLLVRSTFGIRTLLYQSLTRIKHPFLRLLLEVRPHSEIINSFFILQKT